MKRKEAITKVKEKLWKFGYSVRDYSDVDAIKFDLIVEGKFILIVGKSVPKDYNWPEICDVFVRVDDKQITFIEKSGPDRMMSKSPYDVFGRKKLIKKQSHGTKITKR